MTETHAVTVLSENRNNVIWGVAYERQDGRIVTAAGQYPTRSLARSTKSQYRDAGLNAWVVRYTPVIDTRS